MAAEYAPKFNIEERIPLQDVIPLDIPFSVQIDVASVCNMKCNFCFHSDLEAMKKYNLKVGIMKFDLFKKIIDDMKKEWWSADCQGSCQ